MERNKVNKGDGSIYYTYDIENRLTKVTTNGREVLYQYDGEGKRARLTDGGSSIDFLYDGMSAVTERSPSGTTTASYTRNPFAPGGIGGIVRELSPQGAVPESYYLYDGQGSVSATADSGGSLMSSADYDAFGNLINQSGIATSSHRYSTKEQDSAGLLYYGRRYYDPSIGRFITPDPLGMIDGPNVYLFCGNDPVNLVDLWGLRKEEQGWKWGPENMLWQYLYNSGELVNPSFWNIWQRKFDENRMPQAVSFFSIFPFPETTAISVGISKGLSEAEGFAKAQSFKSVTTISGSRSSVYFSGVPTAIKFGQASAIINKINIYTTLATAFASGADIGTSVIAYYEANKEYYRGR